VVVNNFVPAAVPGRVKVEAVSSSVQVIECDPIAPTFGRADRVIAGPM
jgi:hypothetical protein